MANIWRREISNDLEAESPQELYESLESGCFINDSNVHASRFIFDDFWEATAGGAYSLTLDPGGYSVTGILMNPLSARMINAGIGSHSLTGFAAYPIKGSFINNSPGNYSLIGYDAGLVYYVPAIFINAESGNYSLTGVLSNFSITRMINVEGGNYEINGPDASTTIGHFLSVNPGAFVLSGADISNMLQRIMNSSPGAYVLNGLETLLRLTDVIMIVNPGTYNFSGNETWAQLNVREFPIDGPNLIISARGKLLKKIDGIIYLEIS